jgi:hypothetical protein
VERRGGGRATTSPQGPSHSFTSESSIPELAGVEMGKAIGSPNGSDLPQEGRSEADESGQKRGREGWRRWRGHQDRREGERWKGERGRLSGVVLQLAAQPSVPGAVKEDMWNRFSDGVGRSSAVGAVGVG